MRETGRESHRDIAVGGGRNGGAQGSEESLLSPNERAIPQWWSYSGTGLSGMSLRIPDFPRVCGKSELKKPDLRHTVWCARAGERPIWVVPRTPTYDPPLIR
jgi:hypothetical protein